MPQLLFTLLAMFSGASIGAAIFAAWCMFKLRKLTHNKGKRLYTYRILIRVGLSGTFGTLLTVIVPQASVEPRPASWAYIGFLALAAAGLVGDAGVVSDQLASVESRTEEFMRQEDEDIRDARTSEDKERASLRGWQDDTRYTGEEDV